MLFSPSGLNELPSTNKAYKPCVEYKGTVPQSELQSKQKELELEANNLISRGGKVVSVGVYSYEEASELCGGGLPDYIPKESTPRVVKLGDFPGCPCGGTHVSDISDLVSMKVYDAKVSIRSKLHILQTIRSKLSEIDPKEEDHSEFRKRVFPGVPNLKGEHLLKLINKDVKFNKLDDEDVVRVCLLLALDYVFMGQELRHVITNAIVNLVDDFYKWDAFPWGEYMWSLFHERVYNVAVDRRKFHLDKLASNPKYEANYVLYGFVFPLKIWALETFSNSLHWWRKSENVIPRGVAWNNGLKFEKSSYDRLFYSENSSFNKLTPSAIEMNELWWRSSLDYFNKITPSKTVLRSATRAVDKEDVRTRAVDEDIRERAELLKIVKEQEQMIVDLQLRLLSVEEITEQLKPGTSNVDHLDQ
ncbi:phospholipase-like protein, partial [Tanacetum coccineum]